MDQHDPRDIPEALDRGLEAWGRDFEPSADFDARLMARIGREADSIQRAAEARARNAMPAGAQRGRVRREALTAGMDALLAGLAWVTVFGLALVATLAALPASLPLSPSMLLGTLALPVLAAGFVLVAERFHPRGR